MRRADRLLALMEALRSRPLVTGSQLAVALEVSLRTVYRDVAALVRTGVPVRGEAGVGYSLEPGYFLPPLNLTPEEAEAVALGMKILESVADPSVTPKVASALSKLRAVVSRESQTAMDRDVFSVPRLRRREVRRCDLDQLRHAVEGRRVLELDYVSRSGRRTVRTVRPLSISFAGTWFMIAWCEEKEDVRWLRLDRIENVRPTGRIFRLDGAQHLSDHLRKLERLAQLG